MGFNSGFQGLNLVDGNGKVVIQTQPLLKATGKYVKKLRKLVEIVW